ncbi:DNA-directed RNA polymerase III subunit RPC10 [Fulvia fulva]|uniref:DNA-directed RNA polymerase subunit n=1 Tax=Passalora fulva TaxID=5499 RepID=A0A9Q8L847_PASFU|nr:DNA-directed RNA polymerase III subunit RPC10 [Fulvia fulva]KAK4634740.1 DNA-directed RNA polymerase III subunit RPC10 [Fulvia fulva]KAK4637659.1 DNA-directed RNA polymerase III subunit RPC10 [Fulvia fulva]UJO12551.1 DNA-directed RNA polymerase III subunit RPC10 [Fulvia fulva]WPV10350.1 DNA-directed RNA polymerase III subunit RPC10 [Fulvia fulva]WPV23173.1 DNA-directed RNA polymerase III subunit RPC10 [Fulvia fulva]
MLLFCPSCSNMLIITQIPAAHCTPEEDELPGQNRFECRTCPYQMVLDRRYYERKTMKLKAVEDILGGADSWKNVDQTDAKCANENCDSRMAYFRQVQIRSADEPMTSFYKCVKCTREWREN